MLPFNTLTVGCAVTPTVIKTFITHYLEQKSKQDQPTAQLSYNEGLHLVRQFLTFASRHTVEELQAFTAQWVPHPQWVKLDEITIEADHLSRAATILQAQLGPEGIQRVGGREWWQWRKPDTSLNAEWIEMRADYKARKHSEATGGNDTSQRIMLYVHGGAYFFGSVDEHRYQIQRDARKLKARVLAPKYRLAPQFPFPCGLQDCLASYLYLLTMYAPNTIILAGDSAGAAMILSTLVTLRDQGVPLPAGAVLVSPWCDLTHSFPSVSVETPFDYIPSTGFHFKPSRAWPPPNETDLAQMRLKAGQLREANTTTKGDRPASSNGQSSPDSGAKEVKSDKVSHDDATAAATRPPPVDNAKIVTCNIDGTDVNLVDQIQLYTTNDLLAHPLVSPIMQPTLGGLPPLFIMVGGGEILRDEQIYLAHKCANPHKYLPPEHLLDDRGRALLNNYEPTDVQLQVWDDICHVGPTLSFTRPAKFMYRSIAQFGAWALARAQNKDIAILADDAISVITSSSSEGSSSTTTDAESPEHKKHEADGPDQEHGQEKAHKKHDKKSHDYDLHIGKAGDPLPRFEKHMIRQRVTRSGDILPLDPEEKLAGCMQPRELVGAVQETPVKGWLGNRAQWDKLYSKHKQRVQEDMIKDMVAGYHDLGPDERPPPTAIAGRRKIDKELTAHKQTRSLGLSFWSLMGSKHDKMTVVREEKSEGPAEVQVVTSTQGGYGARPYEEIEAQASPFKEPNAGQFFPTTTTTTTTTRDAQMLSSPSSPAKDANSKPTEWSPTDGKGGDNAALPIPTVTLSQAPDETDKVMAMGDPEMGVSGRRFFSSEGDASPFSIVTKDVESASMITLRSGQEPERCVSPMPPVPMAEESTLVEGQEARKELPGSGDGKQVGGGQGGAEMPAQVA